MQNEQDVQSLIEFLKANEMAAFGVTLDSQQIIHWNEPAQDILGYQSNDVLGKRCYEIFCGIYADFRCSNNCKHVALGRKMTGGSIDQSVMKTKTGSLKTLSLAHLLFPSVNTEGILLHVFKETEDDLFSEEIKTNLLKFNSKVEDSNEGDPVFLESSLTGRELEILTLLAHGRTTEEIELDLTISIATVRNHIQNILGKTYSNNRLQAVAYAYKNKLI